MIIQGRVLEVETISGSNDGQPYSYQKAHILDGLEVLQARISDNYGPAPKKGEDVTAVCRVTPWNDRRNNGAARLSISLVAPYAVAARAQG